MRGGDFREESICDKGHYHIYGGYMAGRFSPYVIKALVDTITGGGGNDSAPPIGVYRSGPKIEQFFLDCGLDMRIGSSSRVPATLDFLRLRSGMGMTGSSGSSSRSATPANISPSRKRRLPCASM